MIPEYLQDRYEEERSARAEAPLREPVDFDEPPKLERPEDCFEDECTYPECDCWVNEDD